MYKNTSELMDQFNVPYPGFPGSELDFSPLYNKRDELETKAFEKQYGTPLPTDLGYIHQPVDALLGSYRDFEVYQSGCYSHKDARVFSHRPIEVWDPTRLESGTGNSTLLDYSKYSHAPYSTHGSSMAYAYMNPDLF